MGEDRRFRAGARTPADSKESTWRTEHPRARTISRWEKLKRQDEAAGVEAVELTAAQIDAIAEARRTCEARVAESRILHQSALAGAADVQALQELEANHRRDLARFASDRDKRIERIRRGETD